MTAAEVREFLKAALGGRLVFDKEAYEALPEDIRTELLVANEKEENSWRFMFTEDVTGLKNALKGAREDADAARRAKAEVDAKFEGIDSDEARAAMDKVAALGDKQVLDQQGIEALKEKHTSEMKEYYERMVAAKDTEIAESSEAADKWKVKWKTDRVHENLARVAAAKGVQPELIEDVISRGERVFSIDDEGNTRAVREDGSPWVGRDGYSEIGYDEYLDNLREKVPGFWPPSKGGGAGGGGKGSGADLSDLPPVDRLTALRAAKAKNAPSQ